MRIFNKKMILTLLSVLMIFSAATPFVSAAQVKGVTVEVNGKKVAFPDGKPYTEDGRVMIPIRFVSEALGAKVTYKKETVGKKVNRVVGINLADKKINMNVNSDRVLVGDKIVTLDAPARMQDGRVFVPLRFVSEALGAMVGWNQSKRLVSITTGKEVTDPVVEPTEGYGNFEFEKGYTDLAKQLFVNNMKVSGGVLSFTLPKNASGYHSAASGKMTTYTPGKTYTYPLGSEKGHLTLALIYPGKTELYAVYFPNTVINKENNPDLATAVKKMQNSDVLIRGYNSKGIEVIGSLSRVTSLAKSLQ